MPYKKCSVWFSYVARHKNKIVALNTHFVTIVLFIFRNFFKIVFPLIIMISRLWSLNIYVKCAAHFLLNIFRQRYTCNVLCKFKIVRTAHICLINGIRTNTSKDYTTLQVHAHIVWLHNFNVCLCTCYYMYEFGGNCHKCRTYTRPQYRCNNIRIVQFTKFKGRSILNALFSSYLTIDFLFIYDCPEKNRQSN